MKNYKVLYEELLEKYHKLLEYVNTDYPSIQPHVVQPSYLNVEQQREFDFVNVVDDKYEPDFIRRSKYCTMVTITFDQKRFYRNTDQHAIQYIDYQLSRISEKVGGVKQMYGCYEYHKNGWVHAHVLMGYSSRNDLQYYSSVIKDELTKVFASSKSNKVCIHSRVVDDIGKAIAYIKKDPILLFKIDLGGLDIEEQILPEPCVEVKISGDVDVEVQFDVWDKMYYFNVKRQEVYEYRPARIKQYKKYIHLL